jgi:hypothetical protein
MSMKAKEQAKKVPPVARPGKSRPPRVKTNIKGGAHEPIEFP